jgi:hypothetical protein
MRDWAPVGAGPVEYGFGVVCASVNTEALPCLLRMVIAVRVDGRAPWADWLLIM